MKKVVFLFAMVLAVSMAMAQNSGNVANIDQYGTNVAQIEQTGNDNIGNIGQGSLGATVTNSPSNSQGNLQGSFINQIGDGNQGYVDVTGSGNGTKIYQEGLSNYGKQIITANGSAGIINNKMGVDLRQIGDDNEAFQTTVTSFGSSPIRLMYVDQQGDDNYVNQLSIGGAGNSQHVVQIGNGNNNPVVSGNVLDISVTGLDNPLDLPWAYTNQGGYTSTNDYTQYSNQMAGVAHIDVEGNGNNTFQYQETSWSNNANTGVISISVGDNNDVIQGQKGDSNNSNIAIDGSRNVVTSSQLGDLNIIDIDLVGGSNDCVVGVQQVGDLHSATVFQSGASNFAKIIQQ